MTIKNLAKSSRASQDWFELWLMLEAAVDIDVSTVVEIGVHKGGFLETCAAVWPNARLIGVDLDFSQLEFTNFTALCGDSRLPSMVEAVRDACKGREVDFLFLDGDHTYETAKKDFELYSPLVRKGGLIGFHDTNNRGIAGVEVDRLMAELDAEDRYSRMDLQANNESPGTRVIWV